MPSLPTGPKVPTSGWRESFLTVTDFGGLGVGIPQAMRRSIDFAANSHGIGVAYAFGAACQRWFSPATAGCQGVKLHDKAQARQCNRQASSEPCRCWP